MMPAAGLGRYHPGNSVVHRLDPRAKLLGLVLLGSASFAASAPLSLLGLALFLLLAHRLAGLGTAALLRSLRGFLWLFVFSVLAQLAWARGEALWSWSLGPLRLALTADGLKRSLVIIMRLANFVAAGHLLSATTSPTRLGSALGWFLAPLRRLGLPAADAVLAFSIGMQFLPLLQEEAADIRDAQVSRGIGHLHPNPLVRLGSLAHLFVPLVIRAVRRSEELALAMVCRGYREEGGRTSLYPLAFRGADLAAALVLAGVLLAVLLPGHV
jgi:energy-coupling factor transport system permease protein